MKDILDRQANEYMYRYISKRRHTHADLLEVGVQFRQSLQSIGDKGDHVEVVRVGRPNINNWCA